MYRKIYRDRLEGLIPNTTTCGAKSDASELLTTNGMVIRSTTKLFRVEQHRTIPYPHFFPIARLDQLFLTSLQNSKVEKMKLARNKKFPARLHRLLDHVSQDPRLSAIVSWLPGGKAFKIHDPKTFTEVILPLHFTGMSSFKSFRRQLNLYGIKKQLKSHFHAGSTKGVLLLNSTEKQGKPSPFYDFQETSGNLHNLLC